MKQRTGIVPVDFEPAEVYDLIKDLYAIQMDTGRLRSLTKIVNFLNKMYVEEEWDDKTNELLLKEAFLIYMRKNEFLLMLNTLEDK